MDQRFEGEMMQDLAAETPAAFSEESLDGMEGAEEESFAGEDALEEMEAYDEGEDEALAMEEEGFEADLGEEFEEFGAAEDVDAWDALEDAMADALDAEDTDEFFRRSLGALSRVAGVVGRGAGTVGRVVRTVGQAAQTAGRVARRTRRIAGRAAQARSPVGYLMQQLGQYLNQGFDEYDALEDLANLFAEEEMDEALPVLAGVAARTALRPMLRRTAGQVSRPLRRQLVLSTTQAAQTLVRRRGPQAVRALPRIARSVGRTAVRRGLRPAALPQAVRRAAVQVAARPALVQRLAQPLAQPPARTAMRRPLGRGIPRRFRLRGPVEITIVSR